MIAIDAMGGDYAPDVVVKAALTVSAQGIPLALFGDKNIIHTLLECYNSTWRNLPITVVDCSEFITMEEEPVAAVKSKLNASINVSLQALHENSVQAVVSAGNSGGVLVAALLKVGRVAGLSRPALASFIPTLKNPVLCLDLGANVDSKAEQLKQFAIVGSLYYKEMNNEESLPTLGLLSNGSEAYKGSYLIKEAFDLLQEISGKYFNFVGNCEPSDIFAGDINVVVCDGFNGNILLKSAEASIKFISESIKKSFARSIMGRFLGGLAYPYINAAAKNLDYGKLGCAILLGVKKPVFIAHGCSNAQTLHNAIIHAAATIKEKSLTAVNGMIEQALAQEALLNKK